MTKRRSFIFFIWVGPAHMLFSGCDNIVLEYIGYCAITIFRPFGHYSDINSSDHGTCTRKSKQDYSYRVLLGQRQLLIPGLMWVNMTATSKNYGSWRQTWDRLILIKNRALLNVYCSLKKSKHSPQQRRGCVATGLTQCHTAYCRPSSLGADPWSSSQ